MDQDSDLKPTNEQSSEQRNWAMACHLSSFAAFLMIPFGNILGPLIVWMMKKDQMPLVDDQGKEALNFQITISIAYFVCFILIFFFIGMMLLPLVAIFSLVMTIIAAIKSNNGEYYRYPLSLRLIK